MLKIRARGGERVKAGTYWNFDSGEKMKMDAPGILPGSPETTYYKGHPIALVLAAPILGLVYAAFLPAVGFAMALGTLIEKAIGTMAETFSKASVFTWQPSESYLAGKKRKRHRKAEPKDEKAPDAEQEKPKE